MTTQALDVDLVVVGAGMAGMTAAARAAQANRRVLVLDKAPEMGGSAALSEGFVWTAPSLAVLEREDPGIDRELGRILVDELVPGLRWIAALGVDVSAPLSDVLGFGVGAQIDVPGFLRACRGLVEAHDGWFVPSVHVDELVLEGGAVTGVLAHEGSERFRLQAPRTLIATGGFQASDAMRDRYIRPGWRPLLRTSHNSAGDGIELALAAGAALSDRHDGFYGHLLPSPMGRPLKESDYAGLAQYHSAHCILLDRGGRRFVDESLGDHIANQAVPAQEGGRALLVGDEWVRRTQVLAAFIPGMQQDLDKLELAREAGARYATAPDPETLGRAVAPWGYDGDVVVSEMRRYNATVTTAPAELEPGRVRHRRALDESPLWALEVQPAITFTYGGLLTDERGAVLDEGGVPISGLLAAGVDTALYLRGYAGGLSRALVFGLRAAEAATSS